MFNAERGHWAGHRGAISLARESDRAGKQRTWTGTLCGEKGLIKWQHYPAAGVANYAITRPGTELTMTGFVFEVNAYNIAPPHPLTFHALLKKGGVWKFPILSFERDEYGRFSATLGPPEGFNGAVPVRPT